MSSRKSFTRKSKKTVKQGNKKSYTRRNKKYYDKLLLEEQLSRNAIKELSEKTPVVAMGHGIKLLKKSKKNLRKGDMRNAFASLITAVAVLSATGPFNQHPNVKEKRLASEYKGRWTSQGDQGQCAEIGDQMEIDSHGLKQVSNSLPRPGYEPSARNNSNRAGLCDGLSQPGQNITNNGLSS